MQKDELKRQDGITDDNEQKAEVTGESQHSIKPDVVCSQVLDLLSQIDAGSKGFKKICQVVHDKFMKQKGGYSPIIAKDWFDEKSLKSMQARLPYFPADLILPIYEMMVHTMNWQAYQEWAENRSKKLLQQENN